MCGSLPNALVSAADVQAQFTAVASAVRSAKGTHVAACAHYLIADNAYPGASAVALVLRNTKDFKRAALARIGIASQKSGVFLDGLTPAQPVEVAVGLPVWRHLLSKGVIRLTVHKL